MKNKPTDPRTSMNSKKKKINSDRHSAPTVIKKEEKNNKTINFDHSHVY